MMTAPNTAAAERFDGIAANYVTSEVHSDSASIRLVHSIAGKFDGGCVVDVACGAGHFGFSFEGAARRLIFCDPSPAMLQQVTARSASSAASIETYRCFAEQLPLADGIADLVISRLAPHHFSDPAASVREMLRVVRPGGLIAIVDLEGSTDSNADAFNHRLELLHDPTHTRSYTAGQWCQWIRESGGEIEFVQGGMHESINGVTVRRWCEIAGSGASAEDAINMALDGAGPEVLAQLAIWHDGVDWRMPVRTATLIARR